MPCRGLTHLLLAWTLMVWGNVLSLKRKFEYLGCFTSIDNYFNEFSSSSNEGAFYKLDIKADDCELFCSKHYYLWIKRGFVATPFCPFWRDLGFWVWWWGFLVELNAFAAGHWRICIWSMTATVTSNVSIGTRMEHAGAKLTATFSAFTAKSTVSAGHDLAWPVSEADVFSFG